MLETVASFMAKMDAVGWKYRDVKDLPEGRMHVGCSFNTKSTTVYISLFFDKEGHTVSMRVPRLFPVPVDKRLQLLEDINTCNKDYRWIKYFIDSSNDMNLQVDAVINAENSGEIVVELLARTMKIIDETYPVFMRTIWA